MPTIAAAQGEQRPNYELLASTVKSLGIETVFGLMSDDTADFAVTIDAMGVRFVGARHENNAIAMAEGYSYATGRLGVALVGRGPATANGLHGSVYALRTGSSVLIIYGEAPIGSPKNLPVGPDYKAFNALGVLSAAGLKTFRPTNAAGACATLVDAARAAMQGEAVALLLPVDFQLALVDAAMNDMLRPALYQAWMDIQPVEHNTDGHQALWDVVGPVCETGDFLGKARELTLSQGECLAMFGAGAYGFTMSSNYNSRGRAAEIMVDDEQTHLVRARETQADLIRGETCLPESTGNRQVAR